jgi:hypothetical protein
MLLQRSKAFTLGILPVQTLVLVFDRRHDCLDTIALANKRTVISILYVGPAKLNDSPSCTEAMWRVHNIQWVLLDAEFAPEVCLVVQVACADDTFIRVRQDLEA